eukprot:snap_masked-scaffold1322_size48131-processed-gene-0.1 protein:Tk01354 transcript:snap_masked-scaffold1322_size48131-processed-gene-0.1-mRNA-1 annotation:"mitochondrial import receptor subunit tom22 homolog"
MSNPSSEVSIEELGPEDDVSEVEKEPNAQEIVTSDELPAPPPAAEPEEPMQEIVTPAVQQSILRGDDFFDDDEEEDDDDEDIEDETLLERLMGLTEMFPESLRHGTLLAAGGSVSSVKWLYSSSRSLSWIVFSSAAILFMPIMIETERMGIEEAQKQQQRQILLGPGAAVSGGGPPAIPPPM